MRAAVSHDDFPAVLALRRAAGEYGYLRSYYRPGSATPGQNW